MKNSWILKDPDTRLIATSLLLFILSASFPVSAPSNSSTVNSSSIVYETIGRTLRVPPLHRRPVFRRPGQKREAGLQLPLQRLFPEINTTASSGRSGGDKTSLTSALLNHSIHHGSDDELDRLVFSRLPQGSKLILRTVSVVKTDEDGNEEAVGDPAVSVNVLPMNGTDLEAEADYDEEDEEEEEAGNQDLETDASSHHKAGVQSYGDNLKEKDKTDTYYSGQDHAKKHKKTLTDTEGKKVTNYKGTEKGLTDFDHAHGNAGSNEGERYKNSKKKNKGRKVTGFKRVYHKEEFQRTEHFYDDEEAKKIAESFGVADKKEKAEHGKKDDKRKYHGTRTELTDGEKVKNEHSTQNGHHKGQHTGVENSDKYRQAQHYHSEHSTPNHQAYRSHHPNHNYQAAYSNARPSTISRDPEGHLPSAPTGSVPLSNVAVPVSPEDVPNRNRKYFVPRRRTPGSRRYRTTTTIPDLEVNMIPPDPLPSEKRIYFATRDHSIPMEMSYYYAPNFGPVPSGDAALLPGYDQGSIGAGEDNNLITEFYNKMGNASENAGKVPLMKQNPDDRYARNYPAPGSSAPDPVPDHYSTILKINTYRNRDSPYTLQQEHNLISVDKARGVKVGHETIYPPRPEPGSIFESPYSNWTPIPSGSSSNNTVLPAAATELASTTEPARARNQTQTTIHFTPPGFHEFAASRPEHPALFGRPFPTRRPWFRRPPHPRFRPPPGHRGNGHFTGKQIVPKPEEVAEAPPSQLYPPPPLNHHQQQQQQPHFTRRPSNPPHGQPTFPQFMNGLMNSVADFFGRLG